MILSLRGQAITAKKFAALDPALSAKDVKVVQTSTLAVSVPSTTKKPQVGEPAWEATASPGINLAPWAMEARPGQATHMTHHCLAAMAQVVKALAASVAPGGHVASVMVVPD